MAIDSRKKLLKHLRMTRYDTFERVCQELDITYTFPPEYYRRITRRWLTKKALCIKVESLRPRGIDTHSKLKSASKYFTNDECMTLQIWFRQVIV